MFTMAVGLAAFEIVLEDGNCKDWFGNPGIVTLAWTAAIFIPAFIFIELNRKEPLVDLRLFARKNFGLGSIVNVVLGIGLFGVVFIRTISYWWKLSCWARPFLKVISLTTAWLRPMTQAPSSWERMRSGLICGPQSIAMSTRGTISSPLALTATSTTAAM